MLQALHFINGKRNPLVHSLRSVVDHDNDTISFRHEGESNWETYHLQKEIRSIDNYLSAFFGITCGLQQNKEGRFMDIPDTGGMTVLSTASLETVAGWFNDMDMEETRRRFRATIEIEGVPAFWEDRLFPEKGSVVEFNIGEVKLSGIQPRARCIVPTRHPVSGEVIHAFQKTFARQRISSLPKWSMLEDWGHGYFLSADCLIPATETGKWISVGDEVRIIGERQREEY